MAGPWSRQGRRRRQEDGRRRGGAGEGERVGDRLRVEDRRTAGHEHPIGNPRRFERGAVGTWSGVGEEPSAAGRANAPDRAPQPAGASRERHGRFGRAAARPVGGASLRSEAAERGVAAFGGGGGLQAHGEGGLAGAAFPAHDGEGFDRRRVEACSPAVLQACKPASLQGCMVSGLQPVRTTRQRTGHACGRRQRAGGR